MKGFLCIFTVFGIIVTVCSQPPPELKQIFDECKSETGISMDDKPPMPPNFDDPKRKCFDLCIMKKKNEIEDGKIVAGPVIDFAMRLVPGFDDDVKAKLIECIDTANKESDECEMAGAMHKCIFENIITKTY